MNYYAVNPTDVLRQREVLLQYITASPHDHWMALVDTAFDHDGASLNWSDRTWSLYGAGRFSALEEASPVLIPLTAHEPSILQGELLHLLSHCSGRPMLSFLQVVEPAESLCQRWQSLLEVTLDEGEPYLLRFADTRISSAIAELTEQDLWRRLSEAMREWLIVNRQGVMQTLPRPIAAQEMPEETSELVVLSASVWSGLLAAGQADALVNALHENFAEYLPTQDCASVHALLTKVNDMALTHGVDAFPNVLGLAVATLASGGKLIRDERLSEWLRQRGWQSGQFDQALIDFLETA